MKIVLPKFWTNVVKLPLLSVFCLFALPSYAIDIQKIRSPGGIEAWLVQDKSVPVISMNFAILVHSAAGGQVF